jgi:hypothetical protein
MNTNNLNNTLNSLRENNENTNGNTYNINYNYTYNYTREENEHTLYGIGDRVMAKWDRGRHPIYSSWYMGTINNINGNGNYKVIFDDGYVDLDVPSEFIRRTLSPTNSSSRRSNLTSTPFSQGSPNTSSLFSNNIPYQTPTRTGNSSSPVNSIPPVNSTESLNTSRTSIRRANTSNQIGNYSNLGRTSYGRRYSDIHRIPIRRRTNLDSYYRRLSPNPLARTSLNSPNTSNVSSNYTIPRSTLLTPNSILRNYRNSPLQSRQLSTNNTREIREDTEPVNDVTNESDSNESQHSGNRRNIINNNTIREINIPQGIESSLSSINEESINDITERLEQTINQIYENFNISETLTPTNNFQAILEINRVRPNTGINLAQLNLASEIISVNSTNEDCYLNERCSICNQDFQINDIVRKLRTCPHFYHYGCIDTWFVDNKTCPICRRDISEYTPNSITNGSSQNNNDNNETVDNGDNEIANNGDNSVSNNTIEQQESNEDYLEDSQYETY